ETGRGRRRRHYWLAPLFTGISALAVPGSLGVPPLLGAMGVGARGSCQSCQFPIPSSAAIGAGAGAAPAVPSPAPSAPRPGRTASVPAPDSAAPAGTPP